jgi:hypothetical protein
MTTEQIMQRRRAQPFRPFRLKAADGRRYDVRHPLLIARAGTAVIIGIPAAGDAAPLCERTVRLFAKEIVGVEPIPERPPAAFNGARRGRRRAGH